MKIEVIDGLLLASIAIKYQGKCQTINRVVVDTGASHTILSSDAVHELGIVFETGDVVIESHEIGGADYAFQKTIDRVRFPTILFLLRLDGRKLLLLPVQELIGMLTIMHRMKVLRFRLIWS